MIECDFGHGLGTDLSACECLIRALGTSAEPEMGNAILTRQAKEVRRILDWGEFLLLVGMELAEHHCIVSYGVVGRDLSALVLARTQVSALFGVIRGPATAVRYGDVLGGVTWRQPMTDHLITVITHGPGPSKDSGSSKSF